MCPEYLDVLCLAQFTSSYENCPKPKQIKFLQRCLEKRGSLKHIQTGEKLPRYIFLEIDICMRLRETLYNLRFHASRKKQGHEEYYAELLQ